MPNRQEMTDKVMSCLTMNQMVSLMGLLKNLKNISSASLRQKVLILEAG